MPLRRFELQHTLVSKHFNLYLVLEIVHLSTRILIASGAKDMDLFLLLEKLDADGNVLEPLPDCTIDILAGCIAMDNISGAGALPPGAIGHLRVSLRELDPTLSTPYQPVQKFTQNQYLTKGEIVPVKIGFTPKTYYFHAGQQLRLTVSGHNPSYNQSTTNSGKHIIHTGEKFQSYLQIPTVPVY